MAKIVELPNGGIEIQHSDPKQEALRKWALSEMNKEANKIAVELFERNSFIKALRKEQK